MESGEAGGRRGKMKVGSLSVVEVGEVRMGGYESESKWRDVKFKEADKADFKLFRSFSLP